jgi:alanine racemase
MAPAAPLGEGLGLRPAWAEIDLDALVANLRLLRSRLGVVGILAVVKADAYGHGAPRVALALEREGVAGFGVAMVEEGAELRGAGVTAPILVLGAATAEQMPSFPRLGLTPAISGIEQLQEWSEWARASSRPLPLHLKVDTGMTRLGIGLSELASALDTVRSHPQLELAGLMSHLAASEDTQSPRNAEQQARFGEAVALLRDEERRRVTLHLGNSAGALHHQACRFDLVRVGLALYGLDPARLERDLRPVMAVRAAIAMVRRVEPGTQVGYNGRWRAPRRSRLGVLQIGYADGYPWRLTGVAEALVRGQRVPVVGAVSMDMVVVDLTDTDARLGDPVTLLGSQGREEVSAWELAERAGTIPYEILTRFALRLQRRYLAEGALAGIDARHLRR